MLPAKGGLSPALAARRKRVAGRWVLLLLTISLFLVLGCLAFRIAIRFAMDIRQHAAFASVIAALELFESTYGTYPPSDANDMTGLPCCGAMKFAEAMIGQDQMGFHSKSAFRADGLNPNTLAPLYTADTLKARLGPFLSLQYPFAFRLVDIYGKGNTGPFREDLLVICDVFRKERPSGRTTGMPILYYRAGTLTTQHDVNDARIFPNVYNYRDNHALITLGVPGRPGQTHPLADPKRYLNMRNDRFRGASRALHAEPYVLMSAGRDGLYGTADDICNFGWTYRER